MDDPFPPQRQRQLPGPQLVLSSCIESTTICSQLERIDITTTESGSTHARRVPAVGKAVGAVSES